MTNSDLTGMATIWTMTRGSKILCIYNDIVKRKKRRGFRFFPPPLFGQTTKDFYLKQWLKKNIKESDAKDLEEDSL